MKGEIDMEENSEGLQARCTWQYYGGGQSAYVDDVHSVPCSYI